MVICNPEKKDNNIHTLQIILSKARIQNCAVLKHLKADCKKIKCDTVIMVIGY